MAKQYAVIKGVQGALPDYVLTNKELETMVDTNDEWITSRTGIKERRILKDKTKAASDLAAEAVEKLLEKTGTAKDDIELVIVATVTGDMAFPVIIVGVDIMSSIVDYTDRTTCIIFGDGCGAVLLEASEEYGVIDSVLKGDGSGRSYLHMKGGGSLNPATAETVANKDHYIYQEGRTVFKHAVRGMSTAVAKVMEQNNLSSEDIDWVVPHQANMRIISSVADALKFPMERVMQTIAKYGNTTSGTIPLCLWDYESKLKKGDKIILTAFGGGFTWGATYLTWGYDG